MAALASISSAHASYTPHDVETARKLRENPEFDHHAKSGMPLLLHPMCGGLPPEIAWESLRLVGEDVMPALK